MKYEDLVKIIECFMSGSSRSRDSWNKNGKGQASVVLKTVTLMISNQWSNTLQGNTIRIYIENVQFWKYDCILSVSTKATQLNLNMSTDSVS